MYFEAVENEFHLRGKNETCRKKHRKLHRKIETSLQTVGLDSSSNDDCKRCATLISDVNFNERRSV